MRRLLPRAAAHPAPGEGRLGETPGLRYPSATAPTDGARTTRAPLEIDQRPATADTYPDADTIIDVLTAAEFDCHATCVVCGRRPTKGTVVHATCRNRLRRAILGRPFLKSCNRAFQTGTCTVCFVRPASGVTCTHCTELIDVCRSLRPIEGEASR